MTRLAVTQSPVKNHLLDTGVKNSHSVRILLRIEYMHTQESFQEIDMHKIICDLKIRIDNLNN